MAKNNQYDVRALMLSLLQVTQNLDQLTSQLATDPSSYKVRPRTGHFRAWNKSSQIAEATQTNNPFNFTKLRYSPKQYNQLYACLALV